MNIHQKLRLYTINRWGMVEVSRHQSVAEHSYNVALIAEEIVKRIETHRINTTARMAMVAAIRHDLIEVLTGDLPSPTKSGMAAHFGSDKFNLYLRSLDSEQYDEGVDSDPFIRCVVKCADYIEAIAYLDRYGVGEHARKVRDGLRVKFESWLGQCRLREGTYDWELVSELCVEIRASQ
jgi:5'-deoxynucleotidase YfbR-like HD superfamily hydrolase